METEKWQERVRDLLKERNAILLVHNYQRDEIQEIADITGDSLGLSLQAAETDAEVIVFAGVHFMAETASILSPDKTVLIPRPDAGCPMADMITAEALIERKKELPGVPVVTYVNTTAEVKAESDICCTSANAVAVVKSLDSDQVLMTPDRNLAAYAQRYVEKKILTWEGCCNIHDQLRAQDIIRARQEHPGSLVLAHPECRPEVLDLADAVRSTSGMIAFASESEHKRFLVATESGILYQLRRNNRDKEFYMVSNLLICPNMKLTRLKDVVSALETMKPVVKVPEETRVRALQAVRKMLAVPRD